MLAHFTVSLLCRTIVLTLFLNPLLVKSCHVMATIKNVAREAIGIFLVDFTMSTNTLDHHPAPQIVFYK